MAWTQAEIDRQYAASEAAANRFLAQGNPQAAHQHHKHDDLVAESQRLQRHGLHSPAPAAPAFDYAAWRRGEDARLAAEAERRRINLNLASMKVSLKPTG